MNNTPINPSSRNRGIAMPLVLISIAIAVVIAGAALSTRDTTSAIGDNAANTAKAKWAAESAANLSVAIVEKNIDTWTDTIDQNMMTNYDFAGADVTVKITNMDGNDPTPADQQLKMTIIAESNGITKEITKEIAVNKPVDMKGAADPWLKEFAIYATQKLHLKSGAQLRAWSLSDKASVNPRFKIGGKYSSAADVELDDADLYTAEFYPTMNSSSTVQDMVDDTVFNHGWVMPIDVPVYPCAVPSALLATQTIGPLDMVDASTEGQIDGAALPLLTVSRLTIKNGASLTIRDHAQVLVDGDVYISNTGSLDIEPGASLMLYVTGDVTIEDNASFGLPEGMTSYKDMLSHAPAADVWIIAVDPDQGGSNHPKIRIDWSSIAKACIHAPHGDIKLERTSMFVGRMTGKHIQISASRFMYDPSLDNLAGYTNCEGPLYDQTTKRPIDGLDTATAAYDWKLGMEYFYTWISQQVAADPEGGKSGGIIIRTDQESELTKVFEGKSGL